MAIVWNEDDENSIEALKILQEKKGKHSLLVSEGNFYCLSFKVIDELKANNFLYQITDINNSDNISEITGIDVKKISQDKTNSEKIEEAIQYINNANILLQNIS